MSKMHSNSAYLISKVSGTHHNGRVIETNVYLVSVTYGNRFNYVKEVINAAINEGVAKIILVDNNSDPRSREGLRSLENEMYGKLKVIYLSENVGSAGGYKIGLYEAYKDEKCEFIWLLDDDNIPIKGALSKLINYWINLDVNYKKRNIALLSYRIDREIYKRAIFTKNPSLVLGRKDSFMGFHYLDIIEKAKIRIGFKQTKSLYKNIDSGRVYVAPYGGLFFHKHLLDIIGYPDDRFFVYGDDFDFTIRIPNIILVLNSKIVDLEKSFHKTYSLFSSKVFNSNSPKQIYYMARNSIFFLKKNNLIKNKFMFLINISIYILLNFILLPFNINKKPISKILYMLNGIKDGFNQIKYK